MSDCSVCKLHLYRNWALDLDRMERLAGHPDGMAFIEQVRGGRRCQPAICPTFPPEVVMQFSAKWPSRYARVPQ